MLYSTPGRLARVAGMNESYKEDPSCRISTLVGVIASLRYDEGATEPYAIIVELRNGRRHFIALDASLYQDLSNADLGNFEAALVKGRRVRAKAFGCGAGGRGDLQVSSIDFL